ncbi:MAG: hypothetical protein KAJ66_06340 [Candidatus Omnitrophica bacterium]|nr:hypothetical protein [Candidatus Omnitrophota bacterium]
MDKKTEGVSVRRESDVPSILSKILHDKKMIKRILFTLGIVIVYKLLTFMPIPGIDIEALRASFNNSDNIARINIFNAGELRRVSICALGLMPYFSSCILIMILGAVIPFFKRCYAMGGQKGREKIVKSTYYLTIALSLVQGYFISQWLESANFGGLSMVISPGWGFRIITVFSLTAGVFLLLWLARLINDHGIGNGVAILVLFGIVPKFLIIIGQFVQRDLAGGQLFFLLVTFIASIAVTWLMSTSTQKVPIIYNNSNIKNSITLRFSWTGKAPIGFAQVVIFFPVTIAAFCPWLNKFATLISHGGWLYTILYSISILFFAYFLIAVLFRPREISDKMKKHGCQIENVALGRETAEYLNSKMNRNTIVTALFLIAVGILPSIYSKTVCSVSYLTITFISYATLVVIVGIFYDLKCQIESYFAMKESDKGEWGVAYVALDEIEAEIKKGFLETKDIPCVIEPLRFTWGMPIRTAVDQYRLYVPSKKQEEAVKILVQNS